MDDHAILLISCSDQKGITAGITNFVFQNGGNIVHADQHIDDQSNTFFMRIEWDLKGFAIDKGRIKEEFAKVMKPFHMNFELFFTQRPARLAVFVSKHLHCLADIIMRYKEGQYHCAIPLVISNHPDAKDMVLSAGIEFVEIPVTHENNKEAEQRQMTTLKRYEIDLIILARYHQILTPHFTDSYRQKIINIHHSFLPAFPGKDPYARAYNKGVKIIGATSHFVTEVLDEGPIIEQDTVRVSHRDSLMDMVRKGKDLEKKVLNQAIRWTLDHKILCYGKKTVIFD